MSAGGALRVLLLNYEFPPMGGGAGHASFQIARVLVSRGCRVEVVTSGLAGQPGRETVDGVVVHRVRSRRKSVQDCGFRGAWSYVAAARPVLQRLLRAERFDVLHYFFGLPTGALSLCTPGAGRIPSVISLRGSDVPGYDRGSVLLRAAHALLKPVTRRIWSQAGAVVANSGWLGRLAETAVPGTAVDVIPNAIEERFAPAARNGRAGPWVEVLAVARLIPRKGLEELLHAMALLRGESVRLVIQGQGSHADTFQRLAVSLGVADRVSFGGFKPRPLLPEVYQHADLFVLPSRSESCSMALLEAMACGLPVVATRAGGTVEHVEDGINGLLAPPHDPTALAGAIRRLSGDADLRRQMGAQNAQRAQAYRWDAVVDAYLATYRRVICACGQHNGAAHGAS